jgi:glucose-fructose oxidoreductase
MADTNTSPEQKRNSGRKKPRASKVRYAVVGLGYITQIAVLPAFKHAHETSELVALVSGDEEKRRKLATKYKVNKTFGYERYADCLASGDIDAVYIALPNNMHRAYSEGAARLGFRSSLYRSCQSGIGGS